MHRRAVTIKRFGACSAGGFGALCRINRGARLGLVIAIVP